MIPEEKCCKTIFGKRKSIFSTPYRPNTTALGEYGKKRFSANETHFLEPLPLHKGPALEENPYPSTLHQLCLSRKMVKKRFSASKNHVLEPLPRPNITALEEDGKKRFSASENHSLEQVSLQKAPALEECGKKLFSRSENHFLEPLPLHRAPALEEDGKKRFSASENHFLEPLPFHKAPALEEDGKKNDFRPAKITFWSPHPSTRHQPWRKMVKKSIFGKRKSLFGALTFPQSTGFGGNCKKRFSTSENHSLPQSTSSGGIL